MNKSKLLEIVFWVACFFIIFYSFPTFAKTTINSDLVKSIEVSNINEELAMDSQNSKVFRATVNNDVTNITVDVKTKDSSSQVTVTGNTNLDIGTNKVSIDVSNGSTTEQYILYIRRYSPTIEETPIVSNVQASSEVEQEQVNEQIAQGNNIGNEIDETSSNIDEQEEQTNDVEEATNSLEVESQESVDNESKNEIQENTNYTNIVIFFVVVAIIIILIIVISKKMSSNQKKGKRRK